MQVRSLLASGLATGLLLAGCAADGELAPRRMVDWEGYDRHPNPTLLATVPAGTDLQTHGARSFEETWIAMARSAERRLDLSFFYASDAGPGGGPDPGRATKLTGVVEALEDAAARGVRVRFLTHAGFVETYPALLERLGDAPGIEVRPYTMPVLAPDGTVIAEPGPGDPRPGAMHAKVAILDGASVALGSANFDWRALEHIHEVGVLVHDNGRTRLVDAFQDVFDLDWHLAGGGSLADAPALRFGAQQAPVLLDRWTGWWGGISGYWPETLATPVFSPRGLLPDEDLWDLPHLVDAIDAAEETVRVELLTYKPTDRDGYFDALDGALRRAAARGVDVRLLVADWGKRDSVLRGLVSLTAMPGAEVRFVTIPPVGDGPGGHIPFARVIHGKYLVVDDHTSWIGTSNWSRDYFHAGRNMGLLLVGRGPALDLIDVHDDLWHSAYAYPVEPGVAYEVPDFGERE